MEDGIDGGGENAGSGTGVDYCTEVLIKRKCLDSIDGCTSHCGEVDLGEGSTVLV